MVRRNWQTRVETTDARRKEAKQKKAKSEEKRVFKSMAQEAFAFLDQQIMDAIRRHYSNSGEEDPNNNKKSTWTLHIWTDSLPSESPPFLDIVQPEESNKCSRRARSSSLEESSLVPINGKAKKGRERSGSYPQEGGGKGGKKIHPRSKEMESAPTDEVMAPMLCKSQFFSGKCLNPQKKGSKGGCRYLHYNNKQFKTMAAVLTSNTANTGSKARQVDSLTQAEDACNAGWTQSMPDAGSDAMEMVYYLSIPIPHNIGILEGEDDPAATEAEQAPTKGNTPSHLITETLTANSCGIASIVYMVLSSPIQERLIYDRYREGIVISDFSAEIMGSVGLDAAAGDEASGMCHAENLPISILEHILSFSEAPVVAAAAQVCTAWQKEIKACSPSLWLRLLEQRSWPVPATNQGIDETGARLQEKEASAFLARQLREGFIQHYTVFRDMRAIQMALAAMLAKKNCAEHEMTYQVFSTRRGAPQAPNNCVAVEIWGPNQVLAAYSDNTLRLFQAQQRGNHNQKLVSGAHIDKSCRELLCQRVDPFTHTKKKTCFMEAMGLDEDVVGCLCSVADESSCDKTPHILVILRREDLLSSGTAGSISEPEEGTLRIIEVEEAVLNYVLSLDYVDHRLLRLNDFLALGGDQNHVEFIVSQSMAACGFGRFMVEVAISIPLNDDGNANQDDLGGDMLLLDRKLFLFSASLGAIVWMGDSNPGNDPLPSRLEDMTLASLRRTFPGGGSRTSCTVASVSHALAPSVMSCEIEPSGTIDGHYVLGSAEWTQSERLLGEGWSLRPDGKRPIVVTPTDIVIGDSLATHLNENGERNFKATITFYSRFPGQDNSIDDISKLVVGENCTIDRMIGFRGEYIMLLVRFFTETGFAAVDGGGGHWGTGRVARVFALTFHVPTRCETGRLCLYEDFGLNKLTIAVSGNTVAAGVWVKGIIMTGADVRSVGDSSMKSVIFLEDHDAKASKKKNKLARKSKGKKDAFARGMSLRG